MKTPTAGAFCEKAPHAIRRPRLDHHGSIAFTSQRPGILWAIRSSQSALNQARP